MSEPYIGEIRAFPYTFAPNGWAECNGQLMSIAEQSTLFSVIGTLYGGDGVATFAVPNLPGRAAMHQGTGPGLSTRVIGEIAGEESVTLTGNQMPAHGHSVKMEKETSDTENPTGNFLGVALQGGTIKPVYVENPDPGALAAMAPHALMPAGSGFPHDNMQPYLAFRFCIALYGVYPSRN